MLVSFLQRIFILNSKGASKKCIEKLKILRRVGITKPR